MLRENLPWVQEIAERFNEIAACGYLMNHHHLHQAAIQKENSLKFLWLPFFTKKVTEKKQMLIENRIRKRNEQIVVY